VTDAVVLVIVAISGFLAYARGLTREALAIGGWVVAALVSFFLAPFVEPLIREVPVVGDFLRSSCTLSVLAAFAAVFAGVLILLSIFTPIVSGLVLDSILGPVDRGLGFLFGVARGVVLVAVLYLLYDLLVPPDQRLEAIDAARSIALISDTAERLRAVAPAELPDWLGARIDRLVGACGGATPVPGATASAPLPPSQ
jgi:membrane protein required for colicin V production